MPILLLGVKHQIFHPGKIGFLARLIEQHHQHHPLHILKGNFIGIERKYPVHHQFASLGIKYANILEVHQEIPALSIKPGNFGINVDTHRPVVVLEQIGLVALFCETNPAPVKYAASLLGLCTAEVRLPICDIAAASKRKVEEAMIAAGLIEKGKIAKAG